MPERWERELEELRHLEMRESSIRERIERGHRSDLACRAGRTRSQRVSSRRLYSLRPVRSRGKSIGPAAEDGQVAPTRRSWSDRATVSFSRSGDGDRVVTLALDGSSQTGVVGASTSPDERYPYAWVNPSISTIEQPLEIPMGSELQLEGEVDIKELLYGDAQRLDEGADPDSGPIWADQPDFSEPYFLPWDDEPERTYLKFFGSWPDGQVLDVYFEVVFVEPHWDVSDATADISVSPEPMEAAFIYGGQRMPAALAGGRYGRSHIISELAGWDEDSTFAKVAAGSSIRVSGDHLVQATAHFGSLPVGAEAGPIVESFPEEPGRSILTLDVTWDDGRAEFLFPIEVVPAPETDRPPARRISPRRRLAPPTRSWSISSRSSEETGAPEATARLRDQEAGCVPTGGPW